MATIIQHPASKPQRTLFEFPLVQARSPLDPDITVNLEVSRSTIDKFAAAHRANPVFEAWRHLVDEMPPVNNAYHYLKHKHPEASFGTLATAHACFQGVNRPYELEDHGEGVYVYVIVTDHTIGWAPDMACVVDVKPCPPATVLTVQVRSTESLQPSSQGVWGTITKWEFVGASTEQPSLPRDYDSRYEKLLWSL